MAKVLRLHKGAADTIGNWDTSVKIGTKAIDSIADPIGANDKHEITSIPSPFARMDLVKRAFKIVAEGSLEGELIEEMLSGLDRRKICATKFKIVNSPTSPFFFLIEKK